MTFNDDIPYSKAKTIADEIMGNIKSTGQKAELVVLYIGNIYKFDIADLS